MASAGIDKLLRRLASTSSTSQTNPPSSTYEDKLDMSTTELKKTLTMCGLGTSQEDILPEWMFKMAERGMTTNTKNQITIKQLQKIVYEDTEIPVLAHILEIIRKRKWLSDDPQASYLTATKDLQSS